MSSSDPSTGCAGATASGYSRARVASDAASVIDLQERERVRIGFDLHDGPAQTMSAALLQVKMLEDLDGENLTNGLAELRATIAAALEDVYELIESLGGRESNDDDIASRVRACVDAFASRCDIPARLAIKGDSGRVSASLQIAVARIVQEALSNVEKHSRANTVDIQLVLSPAEVVCEITDNGTGFTRNDAGASRRGREPFGLHSMRERARLLDGTCVIDSACGTGTRVRLEIPVWRG